MRITRRNLVPATAGMAVAAIAAPAIAQSDPKLKWRLTCSYPKSLDTLYGGVQTVCRVVSELTDGNFELQPFAAGEIVPGLQVLDAVQNGTVEAGYTYMGYYIGKSPSVIFDASLPFGLTPRMHNAWMSYGDGRKLMDEVYDGFGVVAMPSGQTGGQMFGWFRKELKTPADFSGLKMRTAGFGGKVMAKLGAVPQQIAGGDIYPALERGTIDACEWVGPYDDEKLGFNKVAKYYYTPGVMELEAMNVVMVSKKSWATLSPRYQAAVKTAAALADTTMMARYDMRNPPALRRLALGGAEPRPFSEAVLDACFKATNEVYAEICAKNASFKQMYDAMVAIRGPDYLWFQLSEQTYDTYMMI